MSAKRVLLTTFGSFGDLHPYMALALELKSRGVDAVVATSEFYRGKVESAGLSFRPVRPDLPSSSESAEFAKRVMDERRGTEIVIRELALGHLAESYEDIASAATGCDLIVSHAITYAAPIVAEQMRIPWVFVALQPVILLSAEDASVPPTAPWALYFRHLLGAAGYRALMELGMRPYKSWADPIYALRRKLNLPPPKRGNPILRGQYSPDLNIALFSRTLAPQASDWPANTVQAGFAFYDAYDAFQPPMSESIKTFAQAGKPPLVFTLGTAAVRFAGDFYEQSIAAARASDNRAILLTGVETGNAAPLQLTSDIIAADYAPYNELFPLACANIHQGGIGTTGQAMRAGKPMLVVPYAHDQFDNAARCVRRGLGFTLPRSRYTAQAAADKARRLLADGEIRRQARAASEIVRQENGASTACDAICALLA